MSTSPLSPENLLEAWRANEALCHELLDLCPDEALECKPGKGKTIRSNFVHIVGVRRMWLEEKMPREAKEIPKLDWRTAGRTEIEDGLAQSSALMEALFQKRLETDKPERNILLFFAYAIAHEAHHRSQVEIALRLNGHEPDDSALFGLREWSKKVAPPKK